jgi:hypothetical protein
MDLRDKDCGWGITQLAQDRVQCWAFVVGAVNLRSATRELDNLPSLCLLSLVS